MIDRFASTLGSPRNFRSMTAATQPSRMLRLPHVPLSSVLIVRFVHGSFAA
jgi:hypothetical protein